WQRCSIDGIVFGRSSYAREKVYYAKSGSGAADVEKSWVLMPHLMFLTDAIQRRSLPRKDTSASASLDGQAPDSDRETVEGIMPHLLH
ncbi:hypothetical protein MTO96_042731, partial [Rhipicephalus appendiculatus]